MSRRRRHDRASRARHRRARLAVASTGRWLGVVPFFLFAFLFLILPTVYLRRRQLPGRATATPFTLQNYADLVDAARRRRLPQQHRDQPRHRDRRRRSSGFLLAYAVILGGLPRFLRAIADDLLRRRLELRRRAARPRLHLHARPLGLVTVFLERPVRHRHLPATRLHALLEARARARLPLLPDPAHGPDHRAGHRRAEEGVARGVREHGREPPPVLALRGPADPARRRSSAR